MQSQLNKTYMTVKSNTIYLASKFSFKTSLCNVTEGTGEISIEFGNLRIVHKLIHLLAQSEGGTRHRPWWVRMSHTQSQTKPVKSSLWQTHWSKSHCSNPTATHNYWALLDVPHLRLLPMYEPQFFTSPTPSQLPQCTKPMSGFRIGACVRLTGQGQHRLLKPHVYLQMASCPLPLTTANFQAEPFAQIRHSRD